MRKSRTLYSSCLISKRAPLGSIFSETLFYFYTLLRLRTNLVEEEESLCPAWHVVQSCSLREIYCSWKEGRPSLLFHGSTYLVEVVALRVTWSLGGGSLPSNICLLRAQSCSFPKLSVRTREPSTVPFLWGPRQQPLLRPSRRPTRPSEFAKPI